MMKQLKSADTLENLMSELPFSLTSSTTWKELGCVYILLIIYNNIKLQLLFKKKIYI